MQLSDAIVTSLRDWGVPYMFGVSGANIEHVHDSIHRHGEDRLRSVLTKSEMGAAFMADGLARVHRTLGVCCATSGGGMMNLAVGLAESYAESVPVLAIIGQAPSPLHGKGAFQDSSGLARSVDAEMLFNSITKYVGNIKDPGEFWEHFENATRAALSGRQGPAVLLIPRDFYDADVGQRPADLPRDLHDMKGLVTPEEDPCKRLFTVLENSEKPVLILGTGVDRCSDPDAIKKFAIEAQIPVASTNANPSIFPNDHPLYLGSIGACGHPSVLEYINNQADHLCIVGSGLNVMVRHPIGAGLERAEVSVVNVDLEQLQASMDLNTQVKGDAGLVFQDLLKLHEATPFKKDALNGYEIKYEPPRLAEPYLNPEAYEERLKNPESVLIQSEAIEILQQHLPERGTISLDAGNCAVAALHQLKFKEGQRSNIALGMGGLGYAIPASLGAQFGSPEGESSMVICGDGAFLMLGLEIHTAIEWQLPILFVVFNNDAHGMCISRQQIFFDGRIEATTFDPVDYAQVSRGLGSQDQLWVGKAETTQELENVLNDYKNRSTKGPGVLELKMRVEELPPFTPFLAA